MEREFYRIVRNRVPTIDDFRSARAMGAPRPAEYIAEWDRGVSVYDNLAYALRRAQRNRTGLGRFVATIVFPDDGSVRFAKTFGRHHVTIYEPPERLLSFVRRPAISAFFVEGKGGDGHPL
ncbi:MAG: hypothetical protein ACRDJC_15135 [Thermomicrobiales bacterium]